MSSNLYYTAERNVQIVIALLKAHGIKRVIASPGTTNMTFVGSIQNDPWFEIWSSVDERSAAYMACGMAAETGEPVVLSCTGATASRNYMPGLTEAYYRKLPVLAVTSHRGHQQIGHLRDQQIDRRNIPNDIAMESVTVPMVKDGEEERFCVVEASKAILALKQNGGGPAHINLYTSYNWDMSVKEIAPVNPIYRYTAFEELPPIPKANRVAVFIGAHQPFTERLTKAVDRFCSTHNAVVFCERMSGYNGKYASVFNIVTQQVLYPTPLRSPELCIQIGEVTTALLDIHPQNVWRVSEDGALRDTWGTLRKVYMMPEEFFFEHYSEDGHENTVYLNECNNEVKKFLSLIPELPFGNIWVAQHSASRIPSGCAFHLGILGSLRAWSYFDINPDVEIRSNVGGYGIDGGMSAMIGSSLVKPDKLHIGVFGDLAFFYDMNSLGNRHVGNNVRVLLINNGRGTEFRNYTHPCAMVFGEEADPYMAAAGHYGNQSPALVKHYAEDLGYEYMTASTKEEYLSQVDRFFDSAPHDKPILFEVFTQQQDESDALETMVTLIKDKKSEMKQKVWEGIRTVFGQSGVNAVVKMISK